jgi:hypothetical protein
MRVFVGALVGVAVSPGVGEFIGVLGGIAVVSEERLFGGSLPQPDNTASNRHPIKKQFQ